MIIESGQMKVGGWMKDGIGALIQFIWRNDFNGGIMIQ